MQGKEEENRKGQDNIPVRSRQGIYTIQRSVVYKWPSKIIESKCKVNVQARAQSKEGEQVRGSG